MDLPTVIGPPSAYVGLRTMRDERRFVLKAFGGRTGSESAPPHSSLARRMLTAS